MLDKQNTIQLSPAHREYQLASVQFPSGGEKYLLYPDTNPTSVTIASGGIFQNAIIIGELDTASKDRESIQLYNLMRRILKRQGTELEGLFVGLEAMQKANEGFRLCERVVASPELDFKMQGFQPNETSKEK